MIFIIVTFQGDSGSPIVHNDVVIGVLSTNPSDCSEYESSGVYTRVFPYRDFIEKAMAGKDSEMKDVRIAVYGKKAGLFKRYVEKRS